MKQYRLTIHNVGNSVVAPSLLKLDLLENGKVSRLLTILKMSDQSEKFISNETTEDQFNTLTNGKKDWGSGEAIYLSEYSANFLSNCLIK